MENSSVYQLSKFLSAIPLVMCEKNVVMYRIMYNNQVTTVNILQYHYNRQKLRSVIANWDTWVSKESTKGKQERKHRQTNK